MNDAPDEEEFLRELKKGGFVARNQKQIVQGAGVAGMALGALVDGPTAMVGGALIAAGLAYVLVARLPS